MNYADHRALIIGLGSAGRRHLGNLADLGVREFILCRSGRSTLGEVRVPAGVRARTESSLDAALLSDPTLAVIATPTSLHACQAIACAQAGCHLLIEKPIAHTGDHLDELARTVQKHAVTAAVGCQFRFHPIIAHARGLVREGAIGAISSARAVWHEHLPSWHPWEDHRATYPSREEQGGGILRTLIHPIDYLMWIFGPIEHAAAGLVRAPELGTNVPDDIAHLDLTFANGTHADVELDWATTDHRHELVIVGTRGELRIDLIDNTLQGPAGPVEGIMPERFERNDLFRSLAQDLLEAIDRNAEPRCALDDGIAALRHTLAARDAAIARTAEGAGRQEAAA